MLKFRTDAVVRSVVGALLALALAFAAVPPRAGYADDASDAVIPELAQDQSEPTEEEIEAAVVSGALSLPNSDDAAVIQEEGIALRSAHSVTFPVKTNDKVPSNVRSFDYSGADMFETAAAEAEAAYPDGVESAILVGPGDAWIDALASAGLAASKGPILFTGKDGLSDAARVAMRELGVRSVLILRRRASRSKRAWAVPTASAPSLRYTSTGRRTVFGAGTPFCTRRLAGSATRFRARPSRLPRVPRSFWSMPIKS